MYSAGRGSSPALGAGTSVGGKGQSDNGQKSASTTTLSMAGAVLHGWPRSESQGGSGVGADMPGKQELASALVARAAVYVDDREQSVASGELEIPVAEGAITPEDIKAELGEVIAGTATGRSDDEQVTVFDTSGIAVQDLSASKIAYDCAVEAGLGTVVEL